VACRERRAKVWPLRVENQSLKIFHSTFGDPIGMNFLEILAS